jgi:glutathione S-transferase
MKLRYSTTSPYVRKVTVLALETGLDARIVRVPTATADPASDLPRDNPLGKIPALITDEGEAIYDSPVICEYLDTLHNGPKFFPPPGPERWRALRQQALADGILDAAILRLTETRRPEALRSADWIAKQKRVIGRGLDALDADGAALEGPLTIGRLTAAIALGYLDFRFGADNWRDGRADLAAWYAKIAARPSMVATVPRDAA